MLFRGNIFGIQVMKDQKRQAKRNPDRIDRFANPGCGCCVHQVVEPLRAEYDWHGDGADTGTITPSPFWSVPPCQPRHDNPGNEFC